MTEDAPAPAPSPKIDSTVPHSARIWNYWLGGKDNYPVDQEAGNCTPGLSPGIIDVARVQRHFLARVVRFLAGEAGIRQFLDIGTGLPTADNTHEVAQRAAGRTSHGQTVTATGASCPKSRFHGELPVASGE